MFRDDDERVLADRLGALVGVNPFLPERIAAEKALLKGDFVPSQPVWSAGEDLENPNVERIAARAVDAVERWRRRLARQPASDQELAQYRRCAFLVLYEIAHPDLLASCRDAPEGKVGSYREFIEDHRRLLIDPGAAKEPPEHLFACIYQVRRAFDNVFHTLSGGSAPAAELRGAAWRSIFGADPHRYRAFLYRSMPHIPTLITGPTGTGKELVARAVGRSGYIPFDPERRRFVAAPTLRAINLSAIPSGLIESELFGHRQGAFTGAVHDRVGWLADVPPGGSVFLDEIGDLDPVIQVKLLRVLEGRRFTPVGQSEAVPFSGKVIAATHVDLDEAMQGKTFRQDLFYRLCGDQISVPSLRLRLDHDPDELRQIGRALLQRQIGEEAAGDSLVAEVMAQIEGDRGANYPWPGNVRELAQCVRRVLVQGHCRAEAPVAGGSLEALAAASAPLAQVQKSYVTEVYRRHGSYRAAADVLGVDWRTVRSHVQDG